jgi:hypothetical protein
VGDGRETEQQGGALTLTLRRPARDDAIVPAQREAGLVVFAADAA